MTARDPRASRTALAQGAWLAGLLIAAALLLKLLTPAHLGHEQATRWLGVLSGALVVLYANAVPKALTPLIRLRCDPVAEQSLRRFAGWSLALGGIGYALAWAAAPYSIANLLAGAVLATTLLLVVARVVTARSRARRS